MTYTDDDLSRSLESDYRRLLRWYPRSWRITHGEALLGTLLEDADADDRFLVGRGEWRHFAAAGVPARLDRIVYRRVRDSAATVALSMGTAVALVDFVASSWAPWDTMDERGFGPFFDAGPVLGTLWLLAFAAAQVNRWWAGRVALAVAVIATLVMHPLETVIAPASFFAINPLMAGFLTACALLAALGNPHRGSGLLGATLGWIALGTAGSMVGPLLLHGLAADRSSSLAAISAQPGEWPPIVDYLPLLVVVALFTARRWTGGFTVLLATIPITVALDSFYIWLAVQPWTPAPNPIPLLLLNVPLALGVAALIAASSRSALLPSRRRDDAGPAEA